MKTKTINHVRIKPWMARWADDYGKMIVDSYAKGEQKRGKSKSIRNADEKPKVWAHSRKSEMAGCMLYGFHPVLDLKWHRWADKGHDLDLGGCLIDIKAIEPRKKLLIWSIGKMENWDKKTFHVLMLAAGDELDWQFRGWITKDDFEAKHLVAKTDFPFKGMIDGTWYVHQDTLEDMYDLPAYVRSR